MADVTKILEEDHREAESLFAQIRERSGAGRVDLVTELANALRLHMQVEETIVYPAIAKLIDGGAGIVGEATSEHQAARRALADVEKLSPDEPGFDDALETLEADISHHVEEEEDEVFPEFPRLRLIRRTRRARRQGRRREVRGVIVEPDHYRRIAY